MNMTLGVDTSTNLYSFDSINCFEKPLGLILANEDIRFQRFFYIYLKMFQSYRFSRFGDSSVFYTVDFNGALDYILQTRLGFTLLSRTEEAGTLHQAVREHLDAGRYAMVPGNLRELSYSEYYQTGDWKHLFLINGYNDRSRTYSVIDTKHERIASVNRYEEFTFSYDLIERLYASAKEQLQTDSVWSLYRRDESADIRERELAADIFRWFLDERLEQPYKELEYIERINTAVGRVKAGGKKEEPDPDPTAQIDFMFLRSVKYKDTFYKELLAALVKLPVNQEHVRKLSVLKEKLYKAWSDIANFALVQHYLNEYVDLEANLAQVQELEDEAVHWIYGLRQELAHTF